MAPELTIGMATFDDYQGVYFTLQALRLNQDLENVELLVVDNYGDEATRSLVQGWTQGKGRYVVAKDTVGTSAPRDLVWKEALGDAVLCMDCHVLLYPGAIARLKQWYKDHPVSKDLYSGPLVYDDLKTFATHFEPVWREQMWGIWQGDPRGQNPESEPFTIPMQGLGLFTARRETWPGFNPKFSGFGGEEGYIHEKYRQRGGQCWCLPWLRWVHRFNRPKGVPYRLTVDDKYRNYLIGHDELGLPLDPIFEHFAQWLRPEVMVRIAEEALGRPFRMEES